MTNRRVVALVCAIAVSLAAAQVSAQNAADPLRGAAVLASALYMARDCDGVSLALGSDEQSFVQEASKTLRKQGFRRQAVLKQVHYAKKSVLAQATAEYLAASGISRSKQAGFCNHARKIAGQNDLTGQFLRRN